MIRPTRYCTKIKPTTPWAAKESVDRWKNVKAANGNAIVPTTGGTLANGTATLTIAAGALIGGLLFRMLGLFPQLENVAISLRDIVAALVGSLIVLAAFWLWRRYGKS